MSDEKTHNRLIILFVAFVVAISEVTYSYLSIKGKPEAAILGIATYALGILTGSSLTTKKPETTTTIPDSSGVVNVNVPPATTPIVVDGKG